MKSGHRTPLLSSTLSLLLIATGCASASDPLRGVGPSEQQRREALRTVADFTHRGFDVVAARLRLGVDTALAWRQLDTLLREPAGDIFWMYPATAFYFSCRDLLPEEWKERFRRTWQQYTPYRGDTENHFLMYYGALYLFTQEWPNLPGSAWFNGKSSKENHQEAASYLDHWIDQTVRLGLTEWDSPRYLYFYLTPLIILAEHTDHPVMRKRFSMMLEYQLADFAVEYLNGNYCGAHSRDGDGSVVDPRKAEVTSYAQFYFEDSLSFILPDLAYAAMSGFQCPDIIRRIAHARSTPYIHTELKRSRAKIRFSAERHTPVLKYDYITPHYALGSIQGGLQQPIQQHSWDVTFAADRPNNTLFGLHPFASAYELGMFFPEEPELMEAGILGSKASYASPDKWIGGSPYEQIVQYRNVMVASYSIPEGTRFPHVDIFFPKSLDTLERKTAGWVFCRMDSAFVGLYPLDSDNVWIEEENAWRLRCNSLRTGYIVVCGSADETSYEEFKRMHRESSGVTSRYEGWPVIVHARTSADEHLQVDLEIEGPLKAAYVDGVPMQSDTAMLFDGPFLRSKRGSGILEMHYGTSTRILDFNTNEVRVIEQ